MGKSGAARLIAQFQRSAAGKKVKNYISKAVIDLTSYIFVQNPYLRTRDFACLKGSAPVLLPAGSKGEAAGDSCSSDEGELRFCSTLIAMPNLLLKALTAKRESRQVEFKQEFDPHSAEQWCELIKDLVAIANTGGGVILFGVDNSGTTPLLPSAFFHLETLKRETLKASSCTSSAV